MKSQLSRLLPSLLIILVAILLRLIPHPANVAPITPMALFGGVYLNKKYALGIPLLAMFISDIFLGFHNTMPFVYGSFLLSGLIGIAVRKHKSTLTITGAALASSLLFFVITNFGVFLVSGMYPHTISGLINCYILAIPFYRNTIIGDLLYTGIFFIFFELLEYMAGLYSSNLKVKISNLQFKSKNDK